MWALNPSIPFIPAMRLPASGNIEFYLNTTELLPTHALAFLPCMHNLYQSVMCYLPARAACLFFRVTFFERVFTFTFSIFFACPLSPTFCLHHFKEFAHLKDTNNFLVKDNGQFLVL